MPRRTGPAQHEGDRALLSLAGIRIIKQATHSATNGANTAYTVTEANTRRVVVFHTNAAADAIRVNHNAAATASHLPVLPQHYFIVDAKKADTVNFWNTTGGAITVNIVEID